MKTRLLTLIAITISFTCFSQSKKLISKLPLLTTSIVGESLEYQMSVLTRAKNFTFDELMKDFIEKSASPKASTLVKKNKRLILKYLDGINDFGESQKSYFSNAGSGFSLDFYSFNNQNTFFQGSIIYKNSLNTLRLDADERASRVAKEVLLPGLSNFAPLLESADISYFCLLSGYVARDFSENEDSVAYKDGETVAVVISKAILKKYLNAEITDEEVFKFASFYNSNKSIKGIKKIQIK